MASMPLKLNYTKENTITVTILNLTIASVTGRPDLQTPVTFYIFVCPEFVQFIFITESGRLFTVPYLNNSIRINIYGDYTEHIRNKINTEILNGKPLQC